jgi:F1-F0 ATPase (N-ATPase) AtpR subunit
MTGASLAFTAGLVGLGVGLIHFAALQRTVKLYSIGLVRQAVALTLGRVAGTIVFFGCAARLGALPLLALFLGFLVARTLALRTAGKTA